MTTALAAPMEAVGAGLVDAQAALVNGDPSTTTRDSKQRAQVQDALVALARTSSDVLASWERESEATTTSPRTAASRVTEWRAKFDELRVQVTLAVTTLRDDVRRATHA